MDLVKDQFFSKKNIKIIQSSIKNEVYNRTNKKIILTVDQDELDLIIIMEFIYAKHNDIKEIKLLDRKVLQHIVPIILMNIHQNYCYSQYVDGNIKLHDRPINVNKMVKKQLPSNF